MIKQYQCKSCGLMFEADDAGSITCPHCHSGNVVEVKQKSHTKAIIIAAAAAVVVVVGVVLAVKLMRGTSTPGETRPEPDPIVQSTETPDGGSSIFEAPSDGEKELRKSGDAYADSVAAAKERADSIARAEAERQAKEEAAKKAREQEDKKPAIERISEAEVQNMLEKYLQDENPSAFNTRHFVASISTRIRCNDQSVNIINDLIDYRNLNPGEIYFTVTNLDVNANNQVTCIYLNIQK